MLGRIAVQKRRPVAGGLEQCAGGPGVLRLEPAIERVDQQYDLGLRPWNLRPGTSDPGTSDPGTSDLGVFAARSLGTQPK